MAPSIVKCTTCGTKNRIPRERLNDRPVCGKCHSPLSISASGDHPLEVTDQTFHKEIMESPIPALLDCWAPWCGPCKMIAPVLEQLAKKYAGKILIAKLNVDENPAVASKFSISSIPTMLFFKNGRLVHTSVGALPQAEIEKQLLSLIP